MKAVDRGFEAQNGSFRGLGGDKYDDKTASCHGTVAIGAQPRHPSGPACRNDLSIVQLDKGLASLGS
jgi:hypothetical protein